MRGIGPNDHCSLAGRAHGVARAVHRQLPGIGPPGVDPGRGDSVVDRRVGEQQLVAGRPGERTGLRDKAHASGRDLQDTDPNAAVGGLRIVGECQARAVRAEGNLRLGHLDLAHGDHAHARGPNHLQPSESRRLNAAGRRSQCRRVPDREHAAVARPRLRLSVAWLAQAAVGRDYDVGLRRGRSVRPVRQRHRAGATGHQPVEPAELREVGRSDPAHVRVALKGVDFAPGSVEQVGHVACVADRLAHGIAGSVGRPAAERHAPARENDRQHFVEGRARPDRRAGLGRRSGRRAGRRAAADRQRCRRGLRVRYDGPALQMTEDRDCHDRGDQDRGADHGEFRAPSRDEQPRDRSAQAEDPGPAAIRKPGDDVARIENGRAIDLCQVRQRLFESVFEMIAHRRTSAS